MKRTSEQGELDFNLPRIVPIENIDTRGWRRISVASERCTGNCGTCTCISDLQVLARDAAIFAIGFGASGNPVLNESQKTILRSGKQVLIPDDGTDSTEVRVDISPAPLAPYSDDQL